MRKSKAMTGLLTAFLKDENGATAIEYSMVAAMLFVIITAAWPGFYEGFMVTFTNAGKVIREAVK
jgi:Flp pilus assembly pilin Flp